MELEPFFYHSEWNTYLIEFAALSGFARREFLRLGLFLRLNDMRLRNCRKSKFRIASMVDGLQKAPTIIGVYVKEQLQKGSIGVNYFWKIVRKPVKNEWKIRKKIAYRWLLVGCCIVDGDEMLRVTGILSGVLRTFNEFDRNDDVLSDIRAKSDWCGCRLEGRRRISISSILHSSKGNGISYVKCRDPYKLGLRLYTPNATVWIYRMKEADKKNIVFSLSVSKLNKFRA